MMSSPREMLRKISDNSGIAPRWFACASKIPMEAMLHIFTRKYNSSSTNEAVLKMISHLKKTFELQVTSANISNNEIESMKRKLNGMKFFLDHRDWVMNETALVNYYEGLTISNDYFGNILNYKKFTKGSHLRRCAGSIPTKNWQDNPFVPNAGYNEKYNFIKITTTVVQPPLFGSKVPNYINYGIVGWTIAHEIGHAYQGPGPENAVSRTNETLLEDVMELFRERVQRFRNFFDEYYKANNITMDLPAELVIRPSEPDPNFKPTVGMLTMEENMADAIGIKAAFHAYKGMKNEELPNGEMKLPRFLDYDDDRMFFISYAQRFCENPKTTSVQFELGTGGVSHPPPYSRVNALLSNTPAFADTFECKKGTPMNPINQFDLWNGPIGQTNSTK